MFLEFPGGLAVKGSSVVTAVVQVQSLGQELPHATGTTKKKKKKKKKEMLLTEGYRLWMIFQNCLTLNFPTIING